MFLKKIISIIFIIFFFQSSTQAAFWNKVSKPLGNDIKQEEFPESKDVEPLVTSDTESMVIEGGIEEVMDITLDECIRCALGNNPRIQAAMQDVFASDARIRQAWSAYFPQLSWQTGYTRIKQLQLSDALGRDLIFNYYLLGQITASQMLYDFGVTQNLVTIRKLDNQGYKIGNGFEDEGQISLHLRQGRGNKNCNPYSKSG